MVQDSAGFQSQQFGEQVAQRRDRYAAQNIDTWGQAANIVPRFQQAQQVVDERQMRAAKVASDLASDQLHRQQGLEDLQWAQQLHQADMVGLQKRGMAAEIALKEAQTKHAIESLGEGKLNRYWELDEDQRDSLIANHRMIGTLNGRGVEMGNASDEQVAAANQRIEARKAEKQSYIMEQIRTRNERRGPTELTEQRQKMASIGDQIKLLETQIDNLPVGTTKEEKAANRESEASLRAKIRRIAETGSASGFTTTGSSSQTGADFIRGEVRGFLNDLDGGQ